jgi:hypothetical protein
LENFYSKIGTSLKDVEDNKLFKIDFNIIEEKEAQEREEVEKSKYLKCFKCRKKGHVNCFLKPRNIDCDIIFKNVFLTEMRQM